MRYSHLQCLDTECRSTDEFGQFLLRTVKLNIHTCPFLFKVRLGLGLSFFCIFTVTSIHLHILHRNLQIFHNDFYATFQSEWIIWLNVKKTYFYWRQHDDCYKTEVICNFTCWKIYFPAIIFKVAIQNFRFSTLNKNNRIFSAIIIRTQQNAFDLITDVNLHWVEGQERNKPDSLKLSKLHIITKLCIRYSWWMASLISICF